MPDTTPNLVMPYIMQAQAQKHVTHNEALLVLDATVQLCLEAVGENEPPTTPQDGQTWAIGPEPTDRWIGHAGQLAMRAAAGWIYVDAKNGWRAWDRSSNTLRIWREGSWGPLPMSDLDGLGIGTAFDATNRLAVVSDATLLTHDGGGHQLKINKATEADTGSLLFQTGWSGRAEMGLSGNDDFVVKVSQDGAVWQSALQVAAASGQVDAPQGLTAAGSPVVSRSTLLGPVSQTAGVPTGAVIERGNNANGDYTRFADGTQICSWNGPAVSCQTTQGALFMNAALQSWTFPAAFATASIPAVTGNGGSPARFLGGDASSNTTFGYRVLSAFSDAASVAPSLLAFGRWY
ncbi:MAG: DUF2793 domain-containing protein [Paracoccaceae bacterium]